MISSNRAVTLCGRRLSGRQHICAFVDSRDEQYQILNPFFREGIEAGEEVVTIVEPSFQGEHLERMRAGGLAVDAAVAAGQLKLLASDETYLKDRVFVVERMYSLLEEALRNATRSARRAVRAYGDMDWVLRNLPTTDELMAYEARVNLLTPQYDCTLLCVYDMNRCSGRMVADILATHSHVILDGNVQENPYFVEPLAYLKRVALRRKYPAPIQKSLEESRRVDGFG
ncbi:MAG TPA: MEDS domain-containing protein [Burkholderiales bacterium]